MAYYSYTVRGRYENGNTATFSGYLSHPSAEDYPSAAFDQAVKTCQDVTPGLVVDLSKPGQVVLRKLKKKPKGLR